MMNSQQSLALDVFLDCLEAKSIQHSMQTDGTVRFPCTGHDGEKESAVASCGDDGRLLLYCHSRGCSAEEICRGAGMEPHQMFPDSERKASRQVARKISVDGKKTTLHDSEQSAVDGVRWSVFQKQKDVASRLPDRQYRYHDADGNHVGTVVIWKFLQGQKEARQICKHGDGWICKGMPSPRPLYGLPTVMEADSVVVCEGEKAANAIQSIGLVATTPTQGAQSPKMTDWSVLAYKHVIISIDNDQAGREFAKLVIDLLPESVLSIRVVELIDDWPGLSVKGDAADWVEKFSHVDHAELCNRFMALPNHFEAINAIVLTKKRHTNNPNQAESERPKIELTLDEKCVNDQVIQALANRGDIFDHNGSLAVVVDEDIDGEEPRKKIQHLSLATLRELISETCKFYLLLKDKATGEKVESYQRTPKWCYDAVLARGTWSGIRPIRGIVTSPVLRADGSILQVTGYDNTSGLFVHLTEEFQTITSDPSPEAVKDAVSRLFDLVSDFPFRDDAARSGWLASLLSALAREAYRGCTGPLFLFDANVRGSGKSLLADVNSLIVQGREATRMTAPRDDDEARKRITALVNDSDRIVLIDNITGRFGCASLDAALTGTVWKDRRLGHTELIEAPLRMTWYASGNNVLLAADTARRVCHIRLESKLENPEDREGFKYPDIRKHVRQHRPALLTAALTILRGHIAAGNPDQNLKPWGSFEGWSDLVRATIVWCGLADPGETRTELRATCDSEAGALLQILIAVQSVDQDQHGLRASDMLKIANARDQSYAADDVEIMREAIEMFCGKAIVKVSAQYLGNQLSHCRKRVTDGMWFDYSSKRGTSYWFVQSSGGPVVPGGRDSANLRGADFTDVEVTLNETHIPASGENRSTTSITSTALDLDWLEKSHLWRWNAD